MSSASRKVVSATTAEPPSKKRKMDASEQKYYAVRARFKPGVYTSWAQCQQQIAGFKGAQYAAAFAAGRSPSSATSDNKPPRFYGVAVGRKPGVHTEWSAAQEAIICTDTGEYRVRYVGFGALGLGCLHFASPRPTQLKMTKQAPENYFDVEDILSVKVKYWHFDPRLQQQFHEEKGSVEAWIAREIRDLETAPEGRPPFNRG
ncbi:uncharacterized protein B0T15DRAFT_570549 [Chaetomium strumarium]|uniref:Ribonuclease H1 N-terminal domain-containing protein n=1 Tax=Chaetomium strumarium TaxID=1170767 RepID=A0AAJ0H132_9PEZI|nr:hypothetical protein B0T15DRAFT_570549 [Chaetomium strumarium]